MRSKRSYKPWTMIKPPSADGFPTFFYHKFWHCIKHDVIHVVQYFFSNGMMPWEWNKTFITFILKKPNQKQVADFRTISLYNTTYQIVTKLLVQRLHPILLHFISMEHGAFVQDRDITQNILLAQELMHSMEKAPPTHKLAILKLHMKKAYDRMHWLFLFNILAQFGFHQRFIAWIRASI